MLKLNDFNNQQTRPIKSIDAYDWKLIEQMKLVFCFQLEFKISSKKRVKVHLKIRTFILFFVQFLYVSNDRINRRLKIVFIKFCSTR